MARHDPGREPPRSRPHRPGPARARDAHRRGDRGDHARRAAGRACAATSRPAPAPRPASAARCRPPRARAAASRRPASSRARSRAPERRARFASLQRPVAQRRAFSCQGSNAGHAAEVRQCASLTGTTESRDWRTRAKSAKRGIGLDRLQRTSCVAGRTGLTLTRDELAGRIVGIGIGRQRRWSSTPTIAGSTIER